MLAPAKHKGSIAGVPQPASSEKIAILRAVFGCSEDTAGHVQQAASWHDYERGKAIAHQGDALDRCFLIVDGTAVMKALGSEGQYFQLMALEPGDLLGAYPDPSTLCADLLCTRKSVVASFDTAAMRRIAEGAADFGNGLATIFARQFDGLLGQFSARVTLSANGRVFSRLLDLAEGGADGGTEIAPPPVIAALAVEAQTTRETASRAIGDLERRGVITRDNKKWVIASRRMLEEMVF